MRFLFLLCAAALLAVRPGPADAVTIGLNGNGLNGNSLGSMDRGAFANAPSANAPRGFGHWVALDGDRVLIGARGDAAEDRADAPFEAAPFESGFVFNTRNGKMLHRFERPAIAQPDLVKPGILLDSYEILLPPEGDGEPVEPVRVSMGTGTLNWTAHRMNPSAANLRRAVASDDTRILIGAAIGAAGGSAAGTGPDHRVREVHLYSAETGNLLQSFTPPPELEGSNQGEFGHSVAFSRDLVLIGAPGDSTDGPDVGSAYLYSAETGKLLHRFQDPNISGSDRFGTSVAINEQVVAIGAPGGHADDAGEAYLFSSSDHVMTQALNGSGYFRTGDRPWGYRQGDVWHAAGQSGGYGGIGGGGGGGGGSGGGGKGYLPGDPDDDRPIFILPDPENPDPEMPETPTAIPLPAGFALYLAALSIGGILVRRGRRSAG